MLIGDRGADRLIGNSNDDLLIAGFTAFDNDYDALAAILAEWTSSSDYAVRTANLRDSGGQNGSVVLQTSGPGATVFDDDAADELIGTSGADWFFAQLDPDKVVDRVLEGAAEIAEGM